MVLYKVLYFPDLHSLSLMYIENHFYEHLREFPCFAIHFLILDISNFVSFSNKLNFPF